MSQDIMMQLGDIQFTISTLTLEEITHAKSFRYASQETIGSGVTHQYLGRGLETIALDAVIYEKGLRSNLGLEKSVQDQLEQLDALAASGKATTLYDGLGRNRGKWVIQSISETGNEYTFAGQLLKTNIRLELSRQEN